MALRFCIRSYGKLPNSISTHKPKVVAFANIFRQRNSLAFSQHKLCANISRWTPRQVGNSHSVLLQPLRKDTTSANYNSEGDKELSGFLEEEIKMEKEQSVPAPTLSGYNIEKNGAEVTFSRQLGGEEIVIKMNINKSLEMGSQSQDDEQDLNEAGNMGSIASVPVITIDIRKPGSRMMSITGTFTEDILRKDLDGDINVLEVQEVALHDGEWKDSTYSVSGDVMDQTMYDLILGMLEERGLDADFLQSLQQFSTSYEHRQYVGFLQEFKRFVDHTN